MGSETALNAPWTDRATDRSLHSSPEGSPHAGGWIFSRKALLTAIAILGFVAVIVNVICVLDVTAISGNTKHVQAIGENNELREVDEQKTYSSTMHFTKRLVELRDRLLILLGLIMACVGCLAYLVVRKVVPPLRSISEGAREIAAGRLDVTVPSQGKDEIASLGAAVNDVAANYQEVLLLTGTHAGRGLSAVEAMEKTLSNGDDLAIDDLQQQTAILRKELARITNVVQGFRFFDAHFNGREVVRRGPE